MLQFGDNQFHIDPGAEALAAAHKADINPRANTAVLTTRNNIHHAAGLNSVIDGMTYGGFDRKGVLIAQKEVVNGKENNEPFLHSEARNHVERYIILQDGQRVGINEVEVKALKTSFADSIGLKFFMPTFTMVYSGDTKYSVDVAEQYKDASILILNVPYLEKKDSNKGLCLEDAITIVKKVKPKLVVINHLGIDFVSNDPVYQVRRLQRETGVQVIAAKDGLVINPMSYAADLGQRTLHSINKLKEIEKEKKKVEVREPQEKEKKELPEKEEASEISEPEKQEKIPESEETPEIEKEAHSTSEQETIPKEENRVEERKPEKPQEDEYLDLTTKEASKVEEEKPTSH